MTQIAVRPARADDREALLAFWVRVWQRDDDAYNAWDAWFNKPDGVLLLATVNDLLVGVLYLQMLSEVDAWLEGIRVDPAYQRRGIASALYKHAEQEASRRGAEYIRLSVEANNEAALRLVERLRMRRVGSHVLYNAPPLTGKEKRPVRERPQLATSADLDDIVNYLNTSNIFPLVGGLYTVAFTAYPITVDLLEEKIAAQQVYVLRRWERLDGLALAEHDGDTLSLGYIDGTAIEAISLIAYDLRRRLAEMEITTLHAFVPELVMVHDAFSGVGYETNNIVLYTYERPL